ncbi:hypothetical protein FPQ18DRAFT_302920 [Pyronema domesticum]|nr:hypothetical protein FPQ18DRAFT_302920 [Pyronema domesticum]
MIANVHVLDQLTLRGETNNAIVKADGKGKWKINGADKAAPKKKRKKKNDDLDGYVVDGESKSNTMDDIADVDENDWLVNPTTKKKKSTVRSGDKANKLQEYSWITKTPARRRILLLLVVRLGAGKRRQCGRYEQESSGTSTKCGHGIQQPGDKANELQEYFGITKTPPKKTNTIVISGPTGCGKTAAVYELGFHVFQALRISTRMIGLLILSKHSPVSFYHSSSPLELVKQSL